MAVVRFPGRRDGRPQVVRKSGSVEIDLAAMVVRDTSGQVPMTAKEFQMLMLLVDRAGKYVTKAILSMRSTAPKAAVESNTTEVMIYNLRKKLAATSSSRSAVSDTSSTSRSRCPRQNPMGNDRLKTIPMVFWRSNVGNDGAVRSIANEPVVFVVNQEARSGIDLVARTNDGQ